MNDSRRIRTEDLLGEALLIREKGSGTREVLERILEGKNLSVRDFRKLHEINNIHVMKYLVQEGHGISFLYEAAVRQELDQGSIREIPLKDFNVEHDFYFVWRKGSIFGGEYKEIFKQLKDKE
ncbi:LysR substrate-binding domain-containing protein [Eisenbergiella tayi]